MRSFEEAQVFAGAMLTGTDTCLEVTEKGRLVFPSGVSPQGFHLVVAVSESARTFVVQKTVGQTGGGYESLALSKMPNFAKGFDVTIMRDPIDVIRAGQNIWTGWHQNVASNRVDCWHLGVNGELDLFQVGVITHDNGKTFVLHGEYRWRGALYGLNKQLVGIPWHGKWGSLEGGTSKRTLIFGHPEFQKLLKDAKCLEREWDTDEVDPLLPEIPEGSKLAVVDWFISFAGQTGQGIVKNREGRSAWVHGADIEGFDPNNFEPQLWREDIVSYESFEENWGSKKGSPPKLIGVKLVNRGW